MDEHSFFYAVVIEKQATRISSTLIDILLVWNILYGLIILKGERG